MASRDLMNNVNLKRAISPAAAGTDNTAIVSQIVDTSGYESCTLAIILGANTDTNATFSVLIEDGDVSNLSDNAAVADAQLIGTEALAGFTAASDDNALRKIGYVGRKRYVRATITPSGTDSGNIFVSAVWILGHPMNAPTPNPPT